jgi:hypothetical protein
MSLHTAKPVNPIKLVKALDKRLHHTKRGPMAFVSSQTTGQGAFRYLQKY